MSPAVMSFGRTVTSPCGLTILRPSAASWAARRGRTRKVTSRPASAKRPPKYPPVEPAPITRRRIFVFLLVLGSACRLPPVNLLQRIAHQLRSVAVRQPRGIAERGDALFVGEDAARPRPIGAPHAAVDAERIDDPEHRFPDVVVGKRFARQRASTAD